jgi:nitrate/nitrite-specific signal transduction histidine kinase
LSVLIAIMIHRHIVRPLQRLENVANAVGETKDYDQSRSRKSAQGDKWSFCLTAGTLWPANQERP